MFKLLSKYSHFRAGRLTLKHCLYIETIPRQSNFEFDLKIDKTRYLD